MAREFKIFDRSKGGEVVSIIVADGTLEEMQKDKRPVIAEFFISLLHEEDVQRKRAKAFRDQLTADWVAKRLD